MKTTTIILTIWTPRLKGNISKQWRKYKIPLEASKAYLRGLDVNLYDLIWQGPAIWQTRHIYNVHTTGTPDNSECHKNIQRSMLPTFGITWNAIKVDIMGWKTKTVVAWISDRCKNSSSSASHHIKIHTFSNNNLYLEF